MKDLIHPLPGIKYGAKATGSTLLFFRDSENPEYNEMYRKMETDKSLPIGNKEGEKLVEKGKYAFLMESSTIEYITERNCKVRGSGLSMINKDIFSLLTTQVVQVGGLLDEKGYGIAMKKSKISFEISEFKSQLRIFKIQLTVEFLARLYCNYKKMGIYRV